ncbi:MAG: LAGLIDADG family homing endonuclease [Sulfolobales archaeon]
MLRHEDMSYEEKTVVDYRSIVRDFLENFRDEKNKPKYIERISEALRKSRKYVVIDYMDIYSFSEELAKKLIDEPLKIIREVFEPVLREFIASEFNIEAEIKPRFRGLPVSYRIRDLRNEHINKLIQIEGIVVRMTPPKHRIYKAVIRHDLCGGKFDVVVDGEFFEIPKRCPICNESKGSFEVLEDETQYIDYQKIVVSEMPEELPPGHMPRQLTVILEEDLVDVARPGDRVIITGVLRLARDKSSRRKVLRTIYDAELLASHIELSQKGVEQIELTDKDIEEIKKLAKDPLIRRKIITSIAPSIYGLWDIKEAIALLLFGGVPKQREDGTRVRGDIHVLIIGDPGTAKSQLLQFTAKIAPRGLFTSGRGSTAAGLCISGDQWIYTIEGPVKARDLVEREFKKTIFSVDGVFFTKDTSLDVFSVDTERSNVNRDRITHSYMLWIDSPVEIETEINEKIKVSPETKLIVYEDGVLKWRSAKEIRSGDYIAIVKRLFNFSEKDPAFKPDVWNIGDITLEFRNESIIIKDHRNKYVNGSEELVIPLNDLIRLITVLMSNNVAIRYSEKGLELRLDTEGVAGELIKTLERSGVKYTVNDLGIKTIHIQDPFFSKALYTIMEKNDLGAPNILSIIAKSSNNTLRIFLREVLRHFGRRDLRGIIFISSSKEDFLQYLRFLLKRFGVFSYIIGDEYENTYHLIISDRDSLEKLSQIIPHEILMYEELDLEIPEDAVKNLNDDIILVKVKDLWYTTGDLMYDFTTEKFENFIAEGFIVHNTASVLRDKTTGEYYLEAGALVLGDLGVVCIDEIDKMREEDRVAIHEALEQQTVSISKAGIYAVLNARASVLAAGNPRYGRYEEDRHITENINLPPTILSRFDLIFVLRDKPNPEEDRRLASYIVETHARYDEIKPIIDPQLLRKYIAYARTYVKPVLSEEARKMLVDFFVEMRRAAAESKGAVPISITARQMESLIRLAEAHARMALKEVVDVEDAAEAIRMTLIMLSNVGIDIETREIDIDSIMTGKPLSRRKKIHEIEDVIKQITKTEGKPCASLNELKTRLQQSISEDEVERLVNMLYREGILIQVKPYCYKLVEG